MVWPLNLVVGRAGAVNHFTSISFVVFGPALTGTGIAKLLRGRTIASRRASVRSNAQPPFWLGVGAMFIAAGYLLAGAYAI